MRSTRMFAKLAALAAVATLSLTACGGGSDAQAGKPLAADIKTVRIGVTDAAESYWQVYKDEVKNQLGIEVVYTNFSDYNQPNPALAEGELELNEFQHLQYLANYNNKQSQDLQPIGATAVYPLPLYSTKHQSVEEIPQGGKIAIPNDAVNMARALGVLSDAGLVKLNTAASTTLTAANVDKDASKVEVVVVDAKQTAQQVRDLDGAVVNNNFATAAKLPESDIIAQDEPDSAVAKPYINIFVARAADKDNETLKKLVAIYHEPAVEEAVRKDLGGRAIFKSNTPQDLQDELAKIQKDLKDAEEEEKAAK